MEWKVIWWQAASWLIHWSGKNWLNHLQNILRLSWIFFSLGLYQRTECAALTKTFQWPDYIILAFYYFPPAKSALLPFPHVYACLKNTVPINSLSPSHFIFMTQVDNVDQDDTGHNFPPATVTQMNNGRQPGSFKHHQTTITGCRISVYDCLGNIWKQSNALEEVSVKS